MLDGDEDIEARQELSLGRQRRKGSVANIVLLTVSYACGLANATTVANAAPIISTDVIGSSRGVATLTIGMLLLGSAIVSPFGAIAMERCGRRPSFILTCVVVLLFGVGPGVAALYLRSAIALNVCCFFVGVGQGMAQFYRFAVVEVSDGFPASMVISIVISGGLAAGLIGPQGSRLTRTAVEGGPEFLGTFVMMAALCVANLVAVAGVSFLPHKPTAPSLERWEALGKILKRADTMLAVAIATLAHTTMLLLMSPIVVAVEDSGQSYDSGTNILMGHFIGMFLPGLFVGVMLERFGPFLVAYIGGVLFSGASACLLLGEDLLNFAIGMSILGVAWNMLFSSATFLLTKTYDASSAIAVQGLNDFVIFGVAGIGAFASGYVYQASNWFVVVECASGGVVLELAVLVLLRRHLRLKTATSFVQDPKVLSGTEEEFLIR